MNNEQQEQTAEQPKTKRMNLELHPARAKCLERLNGEVQRLAERPDVIALNANQACLHALLRTEVEAAGMEMPAKYLFGIESREDGKSALVIIAQE